MRLRARGPRDAPASGFASSAGAGDARRLAPPGRNPFVHELRLGALRKAQVGAWRRPRPSPHASPSLALAPLPARGAPPRARAAGPPALRPLRPRAGLAWSRSGPRDVTWSLMASRVGTSSVTGVRAGDGGVLAVGFPGEERREDFRISVCKLFSGKLAGEAPWG